jgi:hypothetical protein
MVHHVIPATGMTRLCDTMAQGDVQSISEALERLALALGDAGAVPVAELIRALERAAERLRTHSVAAEQPDDLVTQAEASRRVGVSRQAVNQWVRNGTISSYVRESGSSRQTPEVSLSEVLVAANRRSREVPYSSGRRRELTDFLTLLEQGPAAEVAAGLREALDDDDHTSSSDDRTRVLREFVISSMGIGPTQHEFDEAGLKLLADLEPRFRRPQRPVRQARGIARPAHQVEPRDRGVRLAGRRDVGAAGLGHDRSPLRRGGHRRGPRRRPRG